MEVKLQQYYQMELHLANRLFHEYEIELLAKENTPDFELTNELIYKVPELIKYIRELENEVRSMTSKGI